MTIHQTISNRQICTLPSSEWLMGWIDQVSIVFCLWGWEGPGKKNLRLKPSNCSRLVDKQSYIIHATSSREEYANVVIDTIEQYAPGFRWSERQILECFHTCIAHPHKSHSLKLRAGQASLARRFFPLLSWRGSLVLLEVYHLNHLQHVIKVFFFFTEWRLFNVIWWHFTSGNIFHGSMSLDQLYLARPTPTLARWSGVDDDAGDDIDETHFSAHTRPFLVFYSADQVRTPSHLFSLHDHDYYFVEEPTPAEEWWELPVELLPKPLLGKSSTKNGLSNKLL